MPNRHNIPGFVPWNNRQNSPGWIVNERGCHIWLGARNHHGYGQVHADGRTRHVHRVRYEREIGPIPDGMVLDHYVCDNGPRGCCNPQHCRPVTHRENQLRSESRSAVNLAKTHCPNGHPLDEDNLSSWDRRRGGRKCKRCAADRQNMRRLNDPEADKASKAAWYAANRERLKQKARDNHRRKRELSAST